VAECRVYSAEDDSFRREVLYNLIEFDIPVKLVRLINMGLNETCSIVWIGKNLPDMFPVRNGLKQGDVYCHCFLALV
jgi:hypothetical protein